MQEAEGRVVFYWLARVAAAVGDDGGAGVRGPVVREGDDGRDPGGADGGAGAVFGLAYTEDWGGVGAEFEGGD